MAVWKTGEKTAESSAEVMAVWNTGEKDCREKIANQNRLKKC